MKFAYSKIGGEEKGRREKKSKIREKRKTMEGQRRCVLRERGGAGKRRRGRWLSKVGWAVMCREVK